MLTLMFSSNAFLFFVLLLLNLTCPHFFFVYCSEGGDKLRKNGLLYSKEQVGGQHTDSTVQVQESLYRWQYSTLQFCNYVIQRTVCYINRKIGLVEWYIHNSGLLFR